MATNNVWIEGEKHFRDANGNVLIKGSPRPDGTMRKDRRINEKYFQKIPPIYVIPNRRDDADENDNGNINGFMTDSQISARISGTKKVNGEKTLEEWRPDADDKIGVSLKLEANDTIGWRPEEMFEGNLVVTCNSTKMARETSVFFKKSGTDAPLLFRGVFFNFYFHNP